MSLPLELYDIKEDLSDSRKTNIHIRFLASSTVREYMYSTATPLSQLMKDITDYPLTSNIFMIELMGASKFPLSSLPLTYLEGIKREVIESKEAEVREFRFWILSRKTLPPPNHNYSYIVNNYPYLYPAWKHFPEQVDKWINNPEYRMSMWPYYEDIYPLPGSISYDTLHPDAKPFDVKVVVDWSPDEFPNRDSWLQINRNYDVKKHSEQFPDIKDGDEPHYNTYTDGDIYTPSP